MNENIYIKISQCTTLKNPHVTLGDFVTVYAGDEKTKKEIEKIYFYTFDGKKKEQIVVSILKIIELITEQFPNVSISNEGEDDFILEYVPEQKNAKITESVFTVLICLVAFFGGGYAIMAYNTDVGLKELFLNISMLVTGNAKDGVICLIATYALGLTLGMILFFNHFGGKKLTKDPSPLEIQMRLYENDIGTTIIKNSDRNGKTLDVKSS